MRNRRYVYLLGTIIITLVALFSLLQTLSEVAASTQASSSNANLANGLPADRWRILADMRKGRGDPGVAEFGGKLYVMGGYFSNGFGYPDYLEVYHPLTDTWQTKYGIPVTRTDLMVARVGDTIYAIGGWREDDKVEVGPNYAYDPVADSWSSISPMITPVSGAGVAVVNDDIYIIGGYDGVSNIGDVQIYDPSSDTWSLGESMPTSRRELGAAFLDGEIYAVGGVTQGTVTSTVEIYDPVGDSWSTGLELPEGRGKMAVVAHAGSLYVIGGTDDWSTKHPVATTYMYTPGQGPWTTARPMPTERLATRGAVIGDRIYVVGGDGSFDAGFANEALGYEAITTTIAITSDPNPSLQDLPITVDFVVVETIGTIGNPSGVVTVTVDDNPETCTDTLVNGLGSCVISLSQPGTYTITASYGGDPFRAASSTYEAHEVSVTYRLYSPFVKR